MTMMTLRGIFHLYNNIYATTENRDIDYASSIAAWWVNLPEETTLMCMTQGDERVRDSHRALEGLSFPKSCFPNGRSLLLIGDVGVTL